MLPPKIDYWIKNKKVPQRLLLSGGEPLSVAITMASVLQDEPEALLAKGAHGDTLVLRDDGKSFKIDFSESAKRDGQGEFENVRGLIKWVSQKPVSPHRIVVLENLERCSRDAPQALLKIIEEPPPQAIFLFTTQNHYQILQTILSRITVITLPSLDTGVLNQEALNFLQSTDLIERFKMIETLDTQVKKEKNRSLNLKFVQALIAISKQQSDHYDKLETLLQAHNDLKQNINAKLVLENMVLGWM